MRRSISYNDQGLEMIEFVAASLRESSRSSLMAIPLSEILDLAVWLLKPTTHNPIPGRKCWRHRLP